MNYFFKPLKAILLLVTLMSLAQPSGAQGNKVEEIPRLETVSWSELIFRGDKFFTTITVEIHLNSDNELPGSLPLKKEKNFVECAKSTYDNKLLSVQSFVKSRGQVQNQYMEKIWFEEASVLPKMRIRFNYNNPWIKSYCWQDEGVYRQKTFPGSPDENKHPPTEWTKRKVSFYEYPEEVAECETVSDPSLIFYLLSTLDTGSQQKPFKICVFGKKQLHQLTITQEQHSPLNVSYRIHSPSQEAAVKEQISPIVFSISEKTIVPEDMKPETFSLLGLHKNIRIYLDQEKRLPVKITGKNNSIGKLLLDLREYSK
jgi:hypothetical protein